MRISKIVCGVLAAVVAMAATVGAATAGECPLSKKSVKVHAVKLAEKKDIVDTAVGAEAFTTLVAAVKAAGLVDTLKGDGPFTVFAPTNAAFAELLAELHLTKEELLGNTQLLTDVLLYHVAEGAGLQGAGEVVIARLAPGEGLQRAEICRRRDERRVARRDQETPEKLQSLLRAGRDQDVFRRSGRALARQLRRDP